MIRILLRAPQRFAAAGLTSTMAPAFDGGRVMNDRIEVYCDSYGVWYCATRERLINAGIATQSMFPSSSEAWRGNGLCRDPGEPLWSVQRSAGNRYKVMWGLCVEHQAD